MQAAVILYSRAGQYGLQIKKIHLDSFKSTQVYYINARTLQQNQIPHPFLLQISIKILQNNIVGMTTGTQTKY